MSVERLRSRVRSGAAIVRHHHKKVVVFVEVVHCEHCYYGTFVNATCQCAPAITVECDDGTFYMVDLHGEAQQV